MPKRPEPGSGEGVAHRARTERLTERLEAALVEASQTAWALHRHEPSALPEELLANLEAAVEEVDALRARGLQSLYEAEHD